MTIEQIHIAGARADAAPAVPLLRMRGIEKRYGGVHALRGANLTIGRRGVVHTLVGQNGSGKSTLLGILAGNVRPDGGAIEIGGRTTSFRSPVDAIKQGVAMVSQETAVAPDLSVAENILLGGRMARGRLGVSARRSRERAREVLAKLGLDYDPGAAVGSLRPDQRQMIEIARALSMDARILIFDEPTSSLTDDEVEHLFSRIRELKSRGVAVLFVSHRLSDLMAIADEVTIIRDGETVCEAAMTDMDADSLVGGMVGEEAAGPDRGRVVTAAGPTPPRTASKPPRTASKPRVAAGRAAASRGSVALSVRRLNVEGLLQDVDIELRAGEVTGLAGLAGAGRSELLEAIFGVRACEGSFEVHGEPYRPTGPRAAIAAGIGYLPPDRKTQALNLMMSVQYNLTAIRCLSRARLALPRKGAEAAVAAEAARAMGVKAPSLDAPVGALSGGNQQKVALGRWLVVDRRLLLLDEPTRGVDVAAKREIHERLRKLAGEGLALLVSSSENDELREICDRILVLFGGRLVGDVRPDQTSEAALAGLTGGHI